MTISHAKPSHWYRGRLRLFGWGAALALLALPAVAMQAGAEGVHWTAPDFLLFAGLLVALGLGLEFAVRKSGDLAYRVAAGIALFGNFMLFWINAAVGIIGPESTASNLMFFLIPLVAGGTALITHGAPAAMSKAMAASAVVQMGIALFALMLATGNPGASFAPLSLLTLGMTSLWVAAAGLFARAARRRVSLSRPADTVSSGRKASGG